MNTKSHKNRMDLISRAIATKSIGQDLDGDLGVPSGPLAPQPMDMGVSAALDFMKELENFVPGIDFIQ